MDPSEHWRPTEPGILEIRMPDATRVIVPDSISQMTPYILVEQGDWFEDELRFVRELLKPGQKVIDIGANYGVYALTMARAVGVEGRVWAFDPGAEVFNHLTRGVAVNGLENISLDRRGVSNFTGVAKFTNGNRSEINTIISDAGADIPTIEINVTTLDDCRRQYDWSGIDFVKIDAENHEIHIVDGGLEFLSIESPLVMTEMTDGGSFHTALIGGFSRLGYHPYRLLPGASLLVPFDVSEPRDGFLLNLFFCKADRAATLRDLGFLDTGEDQTHTWFAVPGSTFLPDFDEPAHRAVIGRTKTLAHLGVSSSAEVHRLLDGADRANADALRLYILGKDSSFAPSFRRHCLERSLHILQSIQHAAYPMRASSLARVAYDVGARTLGNEVLGRLADRLLGDAVVDEREPFLAATHLYDSISPRGDLKPWAFSAVLEALERRSTHSSYFSGAYRMRVDKLLQLGFATPEIHRRGALIERRFGSRSG